LIMAEPAGVANIPTHLGIIPDGNRRWAKERGLPTLEGHRRGIDAAKEVALHALKRGVRYFTMYAFSTENWNRAEEEVGYLMDLWYQLIGSEFKELEKHNVRFRFLGSRERLSQKLLEAIASTEERSAGNTGGTVALCLNYGGQIELADTFKAMLAADVKPSEVTPALISQYLYGPDVPPLDLVVRTSGEQRLSGFMLWRSEYAELYFCQKHWPDFTPADLDAALAEFAARQRRFGS
jgi:undecaprenyl diphosphate synthase